LSSNRKDVNVGKNQQSAWIWLKFSCHKREKLVWNRKDFKGNVKVTEMLQLEWSDRLREYCQSSNGVGHKGEVDKLVIKLWALN
jgi:hypothetical protein